MNTKTNIVYEGAAEIVEMQYDGPHMTRLADVIISQIEDEKYILLCVDDLNRGYRLRNIKDIKIAESFYSFDFVGCVSGMEFPKSKEAKIIVGPQEIGTDYLCTPINNDIVTDNKFLCKKKTNNKLEDNYPVITGYSKISDAEAEMRRKEYEKNNLNR
jgi:hypothetical protein